MNTDTPEDTPKTIRVWDVPTRLFHWALVVLVTGAFTTAEIMENDLILPGGTLTIPRMTIHMWCGYGVLTLVVFRILWGLVGSSTARFASFVRGPAAMIAYGRGLLRGPLPFYAGHNPLGAAMVLAFLAVLLTQALSGLFTKDADDFFGIAVGPLYGLVSTGVSAALTSLHKLNVSVIFVLVCVHILANALYWLVRGENLIGAMVSGKKELPPGQTAAEARLAPAALAAVIFALTAALVWAAVKVLPALD